MARQKKGVYFDFIDGVKAMVYNHNGHLIVSECNSTTVTIDGKQYPIKKPFADIGEFHCFCVETDLY